MRARVKRNRHSSNKSKLTVTVMPKKKVRTVASYCLNLMRDFLSSEEKKYQRDNLNSISHFRFRNTFLVLSSL